jgi:hypothetical protein
MIPITISLTGEIAAVPGTFANFYWNANDKGKAVGVLPVTKINNSPITVFSSLPDYPSYLEGPFLQEPYLSQLLQANAVLQSPPVYFGWFVIGADSLDAVGNNTGVANTETIFINAAPTSPSQFRRGSYSAGQQSFLFKQSYQVEV